MINQIATNTSNNYYSSESLTCYISTFLLLPVLRMAFFSMTRLTNSTFNNAPPRAARLLLLRHFISSMYNLQMNKISVEYVTNFQCLLWSQ